MKHMNRALLADAIDPADPLLQTHRIPRQLEIDDDPAALMEVESLAGGVGREQHRAAAADELVESGAPIIARHTAVESRDARRVQKDPAYGRCVSGSVRLQPDPVHENWFQMQERVAVPGAD